MPKKLTRLLSFIICFVLVFEQTGFAQVAPQLDIAGHIGQLRQNITQDKFRPLHLRYLEFDEASNKFNILLDKGSKRNFKEEEIESSSKELLKFFFIGLSIPNSSFWVNLRPDSPDNMIDPDLAATDLGKVLLEADLELKKDTALATSPNTPEGKEYWDRLYKKADELLGSSNLSIPTLTRPWIVPDEIIIRESETNAYIYKATLKVCLEQDYLKDSSTYNFEDERLKQLNDYSSQLIRELIIPKLTQSINTSKKYASLRQAYYSLILAQWFKDRFQGKSGTYPSLINSRNLTNLTSKESWSKDTYFKLYQKSFKDGEYNFQTPVSTIQGRALRSYFSGGMNLAIPQLPGTPPAGGRTDSTDGVTRIGVEQRAPLPQADFVSGARVSNVNPDDPADIMVMPAKTSQSGIVPAKEDNDSDVISEPQPAQKQVLRRDQGGLRNFLIGVGIALAGFVSSGKAVSQEGEPSKPNLPSAAAGQETKKATQTEIDSLTKQLGDDDYTMRAEASAKLVAIGMPVVKALREAIDNSSDAEIKSRAISAAQLIARNRYKSIFEKLEEKGPTPYQFTPLSELNDKDPDKRFIAEVARKSLAERLSEKMRSSDPLEVYSAILNFSKIVKAMPETTTPQITEALVEIFNNDKEAEIVKASFDALCTIGPAAKKALPRIKKWLRSENISVLERIAVAKGLGQIEPGSEEALRNLRAIILNELKSYRDEDIYKAIEALGYLGSGAVPTLIDLAENKGAKEEARNKAVKALGAIGAPAKDALGSLEELSLDPSLRKSAKNAIEKINRAIQEEKERIEKENPAPQQRSDASSQLDSTIASSGAEGFTRDEHEAYHGKGRFAEVIAQIAKEIGAKQIFRDERAKYSLFGEAYDAPGKKIATSHGQVRLEKDADGDIIVVIIDSRFDADHAGRGEYAVYARSEAKARHELRELYLWKKFAQEKKLIFKSSVSHGLLGKALKKWMNDPSLSEEERSARMQEIEDASRRFHEEGLIAEGAIAEEASGSEENDTEFIRSQEENKLQIALDELFAVELDSRFPKENQDRVNAALASVKSSAIPEIVDGLLKIVNNKKADLWRREQAVWILGYLGVTAKKSVPILEEIFEQFKDDYDSTMVLAAADSLGRLAPFKAIPMVWEELKKANNDDMLSWVEILGDIGPKVLESSYAEEIMARLLEYARKSPADLRDAAIHSILQIDRSCEGLIAIFIERLDKKVDNYEVYYLQEAILALPESRRDQSNPLIEKALNKLIEKERDETLEEGLRNQLRNAVFEITGACPWAIFLVPEGMLKWREDNMLEHLKAEFREFSTKGLIMPWLFRVIVPLVAEPSQEDREEAEAVLDTLRLYGLPLHNASELRNFLTQTQQYLCQAEIIHDARGQGENSASVQHKVLSETWEEFLWEAEPFNDALKFRNSNRLPETEEEKEKLSQLAALVLKYNNIVKALMLGETATNGTIVPYTRSLFGSDSQKRAEAIKVLSWLARLGNPIAQKALKSEGVGFSPASSRQDRERDFVISSSAESVDEIVRQEAMKIRETINQILSNRTGEDNGAYMIDEYSREAVGDQEAYQPNPKFSPASFAKVFRRAGVYRLGEKIEQEVFRYVLESMGQDMWFDIFWGAYKQQEDADHLAYTWQVRPTGRLQQRLHSLHAYREIFQINTEKVTNNIVELIGRTDINRKEKEEIKDEKKAAVMVNQWIREGKQIDASPQEFIEALKKIHYVASRHLLKDGDGVFYDHKRKMSKPRFHDVEHGQRPSFFPKGEVLESLLDFMGARVCSEEFKSQHPVMQAAEIYLRITDMQPFADANRRSAKLLMDYYLMRNHFPPLEINDTNDAEFMKLMRFMRTPEELADFLAEQMLIQGRKYTEETQVVWQESRKIEDSASEPPIIKRLKRFSREQLEDLYLKTVLPQDSNEVRYQIMAMLGGGKPATLFGIRIGMEMEDAAGKVDTLKEQAGVGLIYRQVRVDPEDRNAPYTRKDYKIPANWVAVYYNYDAVRQMINDNLEFLKGLNEYSALKKNMSDPEIDSMMQELLDNYGINGMAGIEGILMGFGRKNVEVFLANGERTRLWEYLEAQMEEDAADPVLLSVGRFQTGTDENSIRESVAIAQNMKDAALRFVALLDRDLDGALVAQGSPDFGASASDVNGQGMQRLRKLVAILREGGNKTLKPNATDGEVIDSALEYLRLNCSHLGFTVITDTTIVPLKIRRVDLHKDNIKKAIDEIGRTEFGRNIARKLRILLGLIEHVVENKNGPVEAINFKGKDGYWVIVGFSEQLNNPEIYKHELREIRLRKQGVPWQKAHYLVMQDKDADDSAVGGVSEARGKDYSVEVVSDPQAIKEAISAWFGSGEKRTFSKGQWENEARFNSQGAKIFKLQGNTGELLGIAHVHAASFPDANGLIRDGYSIGLMEISENHRSAGLGKVLIAKIIQSNLNDPVIERNSKGFIMVHPLEDSNSAAEGRRVKDFYVQLGFIPVRSSADAESGAEEAESNLFYVLTPKVARVLVDRAEASARENIDAAVMGAAMEPEPVSAKEKKGGIDFRSLPIMTQPVIVPQGLSPSGLLPGNLKGTVPVTDVELQQIENLVAGGMIPSADRIKDYLDKCCNAGERALDSQKVLACLASIFRLEEDLVVSTDPALKDILALVEHNTPASELRISLAQIKSVPQDVPEVDAFIFKEN